MNKILLILLTLFTIGCSQNQVKTHVGTTVGAVTGYSTCRGLLNTNVELTISCFRLWTVVKDHVVIQQYFIVMI